MASPESAKYRAELGIDPDNLNKPLPQQRAEWEGFMRDVSLAPNTQIETLELGGIHCEKISTGESHPNQIMFYLHGGGFVNGSCITHRYMASQISTILKMPILLVDYRLAPEHPFPAAIEDSLAAYQAVLATGDSIWLGGDSAGGGLVMSTLLSLKAQNLPMPRGAVLLSPWVDLTQKGESYQSRLAVELTITYEELAGCVRDYAGSNDPKNPLISPLFADLSGLPPLCIQVGDHEILLSDSENLAKAAAAAGVEVELKVWDEMWHVFQGYAPHMPEAREALQHMADFIAKVG